MVSSGPIAGGLHKVPWAIGESATQTDKNPPPQTHTHTHKLQHKTKHSFITVTQLHMIKHLQSTCAVMSLVNFGEDAQIMSITFTELQLCNVMNSSGPGALNESWNCTSVKGGIYVALCILKGFCTVPFIRGKRGSVQKQALCVDKRHDCPFDCALEIQNGWRETFCALLDIVNKRGR